MNGNDSFYLAAEAYGSTVYGGQGADLISLVPARHCSQIAGNRGDDNLVIAESTTVLNSTILGSDITGTIAGNDSLRLRATAFKLLPCLVVQVMTPCCLEPTALLPKSLIHSSTFAGAVHRSSWFIRKNHR